MIPSPDEYVAGCAEADLPAGGTRALWLQGRPLLLIRTAAAIHAIEDRCPHALQPLHEGEVAGERITCSKHGACFDLTTGKPLNGVTQRPLRRFPLRVRDGQVEICMPAAQSASILPARAP